MGELEGLFRSFRNSIWTQALFTVAIVDGLLALAVTYPRNQPILAFTSKLEIGAFATIPLFVITVLQVRSAIRGQKASFIRDYVAQLYTTEQLSQAFHYLVDTYTDAKFDSFRAADEEQRKALQQGRPVGGRLFDPSTFQGTEEERRLDALLGYFDVIGYHYWAGAVEMKEVAGVLGYHLAALATRKVVVEYLEEIEQEWPGMPYSEVKAVGPFRYMVVLIEDFKVFNKKNQDRIAALNRKINRYDLAN
jgi:hypothetical protein